MPKGILGRKIGMTQLFDDGRLVPVTVIKAGPCPVVQKKTEDNDGYNSVQIGFDQLPEHKANKPMAGHFEKAGVPVHRHLREIRLDSDDSFNPDVGDEITADIFSPGERVDVAGRSKGKGFSGVIKRWNFKRGPMGHGSMYHRRVGSLNATDPARVFKGRKLPGRMGGNRVTIRGLEVVRVDKDRNLIMVKGSVPGPRNGVVEVKESEKNRGNQRS